MFCANKDCFSSYEICGGEYIVLVDNHEVEVVGIGKVKKKKDAWWYITNTFDDIRHMPNL